MLALLRNLTMTRPCAPGLDWPGAPAQANFGARAAEEPARVARVVGLVAPARLTASSQHLDQRDQNRAAGCARA
jgi:hypothetical protein